MLEFNVNKFLFKKNLKKSENNPVFLYGYGGFNISLTPTFSVVRLIWLQVSSYCMIIFNFLIKN